MVVGQVGAGKSSLLMGCLSELKHSVADGDERSGIYKAADSRVAYCAQQPWILATSVQENITIAAPSTNVSGGDSVATQESNNNRYKTAIESCMLEVDMLQWPMGDATQIGERGITVSGGQKARISLARAVYSDADLYLLGKTAQ